MNFKPEKQRQNFSTAGQENILLNKPIYFAGGE